MADFEMNIDSLTLLTFIETRIEDLIDLEETLNQEHVKAAQKEREKVSHWPPVCERLIFEKILYKYKKYL